MRRNSFWNELFGRPFEFTSHWHSRHHSILLWLWNWNPTTLNMSFLWSSAPTPTPIKADIPTAPSPIPPIPVQRLQDGPMEIIEKLPWTPILTAFSMLLIALCLMGNYPIVVLQRMVDLMVLLIEFTLCVGFLICVPLIIYILSKV
jgi:hypothetical protein